MKCMLVTFMIKKQINQSFVAGIVRSVHTMICNWFQCQENELLSSNFVTSGKPCLSGCLQRNFFETLYVV